MRDVLQDKAAPYMWSDATLIAYWNEGKSKFSLDTHYFTRKTETIDLISDEDTYELPLDTRFIYSVRIGDRVLVQATISQLAVQSDSADVVAYVLDAQPGYITFYPMPKEDAVANMIIAGEPEDLDIAALTAEVDMPKQFLLAPCEWVYYRCYGHNDADGANPQASELALKRFQRFTADMKAEIFRRNNGPLPMARGFKY